MRREFAITILPDGTLRIERNGEVDDVCIQEIMPVREVLGEIVDRRLKGSFGATHEHVHDHTSGGDGHTH